MLIKFVSQKISPRNTQKSKFRATSPQLDVLKNKPKKKIRIKYEIKYLYKKKQQLNLQLYQIHLHNSKKWRRTWDIVEYDSRFPTPAHLQFNTSISTSPWKQVNLPIFS
jgi:hypothetical protein